MKPKILIFSTAYLPLVGGAEIAVKEITDRLEEYDFEMLVAKIKRGLPKVEQIGRVKVHRIGWGTFLDKIYLMFFGGWMAARLHRKEKYSIIWSIMASYGGFAALSFKKKEPDLPFLLTLQEGDDLREIERKVKFWFGRFKQIFTRADYIQCISNYLASWAGKMGAKSPIEVVPNGVDLEKFNPEKASCLVLRKEEKIIVTSSRLVKKNGLDDLISSLVYLSNNCILWIFGSGPEEEPLKNLTRAKGLEKRVRFFGPVPNSELPSYLVCADVFCRPSLSEGLGNSFLEAMALGLPVVGTAVGGITDFLKEGETGFLCQFKNPQSIAEKITYILDPVNQETIKKITAKGKELVRERYDWEKVTKRCAGVFKSLLKIDISNSELPD